MEEFPSGVACCALARALYVWPIPEIVGVYNKYSPKKAVGDISLCSS